MRTITLTAFWLGSIAMASGCIAPHRESEPSVADLARDLAQSQPEARMKAMAFVCRAVQNGKHPQVFLGLHPLLVELMRRREEPQREEALDTLLCMFADIRTDLPGIAGDPTESGSMRLKALGALSPFSAEGESTLTKVTTDRTAPLQLRVAAMKTLSGGCPTAAAAVSSVLDGEEPLLQIQAIETLGGLKDIRSLGDALRHPDPDVRDAALRTLPRLRAKAVPVLLDLLKSSDATTSVQAARALGSLQNAAVLAIPALEDAARSADPNLKAAAKSALGSTGRSLKELVRLLEFGAPEARRRALAGMNLAAKEIGPDAAELVPSLRKALREADPSVRYEVPRVLAYIGAPAADAVPDLLMMAADAQPRLREAAVAVLDELLVSVEDPKLKADLKAGLEKAHADPDEGVRGWADTGLAALARAPRVHPCKEGR